MKTTTFYDMHSGGSRKEEFDLLLIEAPEEEAVAVFYARFGHNPRRVTCTCCGEDYSVTERDSFEAAQASYRAMRDLNYKTIRSTEITDEERQTKVPEQGYVWVD